MTLITTTYEGLIIKKNIKYKNGDFFAEDCVFDFDKFIPVVFEGSDDIDIIGVAKIEEVSEGLRAKIMTPVEYYDFYTLDKNIAIFGRKAGKITRARLVSINARYGGLAL